MGSERTPNGFAAFSERGWIPVALPDSLWRMGSRTFQHHQSNGNLNRSILWVSSTSTISSTAQHSKCYFRKWNRLRRRRRCFWKLPCSQFWWIPFLNSGNQNLWDRKTILRHLQMETHFDSMTEPTDLGPRPGAWRNFDLGAVSGLSPQFASNRQ